MQLHVIGTGSSGNAYQLTAGGHSLLLDAGIRWKQMLAALPNGLKGIEGCLVTHEHQDHAKAVCDLLTRGVKCVMSVGTIEAIFPQPHEATCKDFTSIVTAFDGEVIRFSHFTVKPFKTEHDAAEPMGYLIQHNQTRETLLYATDTYYLRYTFPRVNYWLVECNYTLELAREMGEDPSKKALFSRLMESHMSLERLLEALAANDLRGTRKIVLIHLSDERSHERQMVDQVHAQTGIDTVAARGGDVIELELMPF